MARMKEFTARLFAALMSLLEENWMRSALRMVLTKKEDPAV